MTSKFYKQASDLSNDLSNQLSSQLAEAESFISRRAFYPAFVRIANVHASLEHLNKPTRELFLKWCLKTPLNRETLEAIEAGIKKDIKQVERILAVGKSWIYEEWVVILTSIVQIDLLCDFLAVRGIKSGLMPGSLRSEIESLRKSKFNKEPFESALSSIRKNWGLPVNHPLLHCG
jgi:hypothetical protein